MLLLTSSDLTMSCDSWDSNAQFDVVPFPSDVTDHLNPIPCYLGPEGMEKYLTHPYVSPLFGNFEGLPPLLVQSGDAEVLRDEITLLAHKATLSGVSVQHELYEDAVHVFQMFPFLATARKSFSCAREFAFRILPKEKLVSSEAADAAVLAQEVNSEHARLVSGLGEVEGTISTSNLPAQDTSVIDSLRNEDSEGTVSTASEVTEKPEPPQPPAESRTPSNSLRRNHRRTRTSGSDQRLLTFTPIPANKTSGTTTTSGNESVRASSQLAPPPSVRKRTRAMSHPDIHALCSQWAMTGPANETTTFKPQ
jgi:hypothetical protein